ncbi:hypothetical protein [Saccharibacillus qingshengii]|uniref:hypothetical protein n=1 Tax=Saccharibacillus qingshengii TaxID=1763540 RepID=UPI00155315DF|nr:hypothetical protein [Saccharibacillus qingshengii]
MFNFIAGIAGLAMGLKFLHGTLSRGKSQVTGRILGLTSPIRWIQIGMSLLLIGLGLYLLIR